MVVNDHTRSAENWKCVWYFLRPIDGSSACAKRRYTPINVAASQCFEWTEWRVYNITHIYIYIYRVYVDSHSLGQLALASKRNS